VRLTDSYNGAADPFEGERTIVWSSLPQDAVVTQATLTVEPLLPPGQSTFIETLRLGSKASAFGATLTAVTSPASVEVDFHARRRGYSFTGITSADALAVDIGGGVFLAVAGDGTVPAISDSTYHAVDANLPGITTARLRFPGAQAPNPNAVSINVATQPSNLTLRFGKLPPFWSKVGEIAVATTTPDITDAIQRAMSQAPLVNGYFSIPLIIHSDTLGRVGVELDVTYVGSAPVLAPGLREVVLPYDYATVAKTDSSALQATLPSGARVLSPQTSLQVRGAFEQSRVVVGPTGNTTTTDTIECSATQVLAQPLVPGTDLDLTSVDVFVAADGPAARLSLDIRSDMDGKPSQTSLLAKAPSFDVSGSASGALQWVTVPIAPKIRINGGGKKYWLVLQALDGKALFGIDPESERSRMTQRSTDCGFSWRIAAPTASVLIRLRTVPDRFQMPIDFVAGSGPNQQRISLQAYNAQGKIDTVLDRPEIAAAVDSYVSQAATPACARGERLQNPNFFDWSTGGSGFGDDSILELATPAIVAAEASFVVVETFFDTAVGTLPPELRAASAFTYSADGTSIYVTLPVNSAGVVAAPPGILALDTATLSQTALATDPPYTLNTSALAIGSGGQTLYALGRDANAPGANPGSFVAIDTATGQLRVIADGLQSPASLALSRDGNSAYFTDADPANGTASVFSVDLNTGIQRRLSTINSSSLAVTFDGKLLVITDISNNKVQALDTADGSVEWTMSPAGGATPLAVAAAANGSDIYLVSSAVGGGPTLAALDERGRVIQTTPLKLDVPEIGALSIGVKPQGDRVYVAATGWATNNTIAMDPAGSRLLVRAGTQVSSVPVGSRQPSAWTLTAGAIVPQSPAVGGSGVEAVLTNGSISQVVAIAPPCFHDFTVQAVAQSNSFRRVTDVDPVDAVAEVHWLDTAGTLLRTDSLAIPSANQLVTQRARFTPPVSAAQTEVRVRVASGIVVLQTVSLQSSDDLLQQNAWKSDKAASAFFAAGSKTGSQTFRNPGAADLAYTQRVTLTETGDYQLNFRGSAAASATATPRIELAYMDANGVAVGSTQQIRFDASSFSSRPARVFIPTSSASADVRIVLPPATSLTVEEFELTPRSTTPVPLSFIAQSPGELHVTNARVVYDLKDPVGPAPPAGGLSKPTPPDSTPGDASCGCDDDETASMSATRAPPVALPPPVPRQVGLRKPSLAARPAEPPAEAAVPLTSVKGVGAARARLLQEAGILTANDLARSVSERVLAALANAPAVTPELATSLVSNAVTALTGQKPEDEP